MKKVCWKVTLFVLLVLSILNMAFAEIAGVNIMGLRQSTMAPQIYLQMRALDSNGVAIKAQRNNIHIVAGEDAIELASEPLSGNDIGHIIVIDTSLYYYGTKYIKIDNIQEIVRSYLSRLSHDERVLFILASDGSTPVCSNYMSVNDAHNYLQQLTLGAESSACIGNAICTAFEYAINPAENAPLFHSVFIVADPDIRSNTNDSRSLTEAVQLRSAGNIAFDVMVAIPDRQQFLKGSNANRRLGLENGFSAFEDFAKQTGGQYVRIFQDSYGIKTESLNMMLSAWVDTTLYYAVDYTALAGHLSGDEPVQIVPLSVYCSDEGGQAVRTFDVAVNAQMLPEVTPAPTTLQETPSPTPAPTPVVAVGQADSHAMQAIHALYKLNYLNSVEYSDFNNICYIAYIEFCNSNGIEPRDGIYQDSYDLLISGNGIGMEHATPEPTATPAPTVPAKGYAINDQDTEEGGGFIAQMQQVLKNLNCYEGDASATVGRLDSATVTAVNRYCEAFNWFNDAPNGVTQTICMEIINNGPGREPLISPEPSLSEKAREFLFRTIKLGAFEIPMWIPVLACVLLVFVIFLLILLSNNKKKTIIATPVSQPANTSALAATPGKMFDSYGPMNNSDETEAPYYQRPVKLEIHYKGKQDIVEVALKEKPRYTIGRLDCDLLLDSSDNSLSRTHAELYFAFGQVYLVDRSTFKNTMINGFMASNLANGNNPTGIIINNGDILKLSEHEITITW